ncbi:MAG: Na+/H+ antiporter NhaA [Comamonas sp.]
MPTANALPPPATIPRLQRATERALQQLQRLLHIEAMAGIVLLLAAAVALLWANSPWAASYFALWHQPVALTLGPWSWRTDLHFIVNDVLMTVFFLVVGMEIRRELHHGALSQLRQAALPLVAALGGVVAPALIYLAIAGHTPALAAGWAIPTATDIAFAVGVLALLGRHIPGPLRIFLLALAISDDIVAVLIIALFYSGGLDASGLAVAATGLLAVLLFQRMGVASAWAYVPPGAVLWLGLLYTGAHPTLAGVVLGLMTPVALRPASRHPLEALHQAVARLQPHDPHTAQAETMHQALHTTRQAQRDLLPPVLRLPQRLHLWVAMGVMPLFALANAGVQLQGMDWSASGPHTVALGVLLALVLGKPAGVVLATLLAVKTGLCQLPAGVNARGVLLVGLLAGIGFTMAIFVGGLAFSDAALLGAAKLGILLASAIAATAGLAYGFAVRHRLQD